MALKADKKRVNETFKCCILMCPGLTVQKGPNKSPICTVVINRPSLSPQTTMLSTDLIKLINVTYVMYEHPECNIFFFM